MTERKKQQQQQQLQGTPSILPRAAWMWKPRSKKVVENNLGDMTGLLLGIRNVGAQEWKRRYVFVEGNAICYGKSVGKRDKVIPMEVIRTVNYATADVLLAAKAPSSKAHFGWFMYINTKELLFCCENDSIRKEWVTFILAMLQLMSGIQIPVPVSAGDEETKISSSLEVRCSKQQEKQQGKSATQPTQTPIGGDSAEVKALQPKSYVDGASQPIGNMRHESQSLVGHGDDGETNTKDMSASPRSAYDSGDEDFSDEVKAGCALRVQSSMNALQRGGTQDMYAEVLLPGASQTYSYIEYKLESLKDHFRPGDSVMNVVFSRSVEKIGKRDKVQERDLVVTPQYLYLVAQNKLTNGSHARYISTSHIVGVIESTTEKNLLAIVIPSFHDILIRFHKQNSRVGGNETDAKLQLIAHLYKIFLDQKTQRRFFFRELDNVKANIRRSVEDPHLPLMSLPGDCMRVGTNKGLLLSFHTHGESVVFWSSVVTRVREDRRLQLRALVVTDGAFYIFNDTLVKLNFRIPLAGLQSLQFDKDSQTILLICTEVDILFTVQSSVEFERLIELLPEVVLQCCGVTLFTTASKHLYSQVRLEETWKAKDEDSLLSYGEAIKRKVNISQRMLSSLHPMRLKSYFRRQVSDGEMLPGKYGGSSVRIDSLGKRPGSRAFLAQYRFVEELITDFEGESKMLMGAPSTATDMLALNGEFSTDFDLGQILHSSMCSELDLKSIPVGTILSDDRISLKHGGRRAVCVSMKGILLLYGGVEVGRLRRNFKGLRLGRKTTTGSDLLQTDASNSQDLRVAVFLSWSDVVGLIQCYPEHGTVVGIMTGPGHSHDYMLDLENNQRVDSFVSSSVWSYVQHNRSLPHSYEMLPLFTVPRLENVRNALKSTVFHPKPTVALRCAMKHYASDELHLAVVPEIAEACRRFGDNTIFFSGVAWRNRSPAVRKNVLIGTAVKDESPRRTTPRQTFVIVITNCAIYWCTDGGYGIVRRTELLSLKEVYLSLAEPDALLITVPKEYDMYFYVDGRGKEFLARLQEAYVAWTEYHQYLPHEPRGYQYYLPDHALPTVTVPHLALVGRLKKPPHFDEMQGNRSAGQTRARIELFHRRYLAAAIANYEAALGAASRQQLSEGGNSIVVDAKRLTWERVYKSLSVPKSVLEFAHRRAYAVSLRSTRHKEMERAQFFLYEFNMMKHLAESMQQAIITENLTVYEADIEKAKKYPLLLLLVRETREEYEKLKKMNSAIDDIVTFLDSSTRPPMKEAESKLQVLFEAAMKSGVQEDKLVCLRRRVDLLNQQEQFAAQLHAHRMAVDAGTKKPPSEKVMLLMTEVACQLGVPVSVVDAAFSRALCSTTQDDSEQQEEEKQQQQQQQVRDMRRAILTTEEAIDMAVCLGDAILLKGVLQFAKQYCYDDVKEKQQWGVEQYTKHIEHQAVRRMLQHLVHQITARRRSRNWSAEEVLKLRASCEEVLRILPAHEPVMQHDRRLMHLQLRILSEEEHRLVLRDSLQQQAREAWDRYKEELRQREEDEQHAIQERERRRAEAVRRRHAECLLMWQDRMKQVCELLQESIDTTTANCVRQCVRQCIFIQKEVEEGLAKYMSFFFDQDAQQAMNNIIDKLKAAATRGQAFLECYERESSPCAPFTYRVCSPEVEGEEEEEGEGEEEEEEDVKTAMTVVPTELLNLIQTHKHRELIEYVQSHEGELTVDVIAKVRESWLASQDQRQWVERLHRAIHTAFALKNWELLQTQIDTARVACYMDNFVEGAIRELATMRDQQKVEQAHNESGKHSDRSGNGNNGVGNNSISGGGSPEEVVVACEAVAKAPLILDLSREYDTSSTDTAERLMGQLHSATLELLMLFSDMDHAVECGPLRDGLKQKMMNVLQLWYEVFHHRLKPSGNVFHRKERDCLEFLLFVGQYNTSGDYVAPYTNRVVGDFKRIQRSNVAQGWSSGLLFIHYMLQCKMLERVVNEINLLGIKARRDVLFEDAVLNKGLNDLLLLARMTEQVDWSLISSEAAEVCNTVPRVRAIVSSVHIGVEENNTARKMSDITAWEERKDAYDKPRIITLRNCTESLRSVVNVLSNYFAGQLAAFGEYTSVDNARALFDEGLHNEVGVLVRERLIPILISLLHAGFRPTYHLVRTRRVWDAILEFSETLQQGSRDLSGVTIGGIVQLVEAITDVTGRNRIRLQRFTEEELMDMRLRMFLIESLNRSVLAVFLRIFFQNEEGNFRWAGKDGLWKFYERDTCVCYPPEDENIKQLMEVFSMLSELPFVLVVDRELR